MRDSERETTTAVPVTVRPTIVGVEPTTTTVPVGAEQARTPVGILDGFVHRDDVPQTHSFQLLIRERVADQTGDLPVRLEPTFLVGGRTNLLRDTVAVADLLARTHHDVVGDAVGRSGSIPENALSIVRDTIWFAFGILFLVLEIGDTFFAGPSIGYHGEMNISFCIDSVGGRSRRGRNNLAFATCFRDLHEFGFSCPQQRDCMEVFTSREILDIFVSAIISIDCKLQFLCNSRFENYLKLAIHIACSFLGCELADYATCSVIFAGLFATAENGLGRKPLSAMANSTIFINELLYKYTIFNNICQYCTPLSSSIINP